MQNIFQIWTNRKHRPCASSFKLGILRIAVDVWIYRNWCSLVCIYPPLQIISKLVTPIVASCFDNVCACCHLPSVTNWIDDDDDDDDDYYYYYYYCKNIVGVEN